MARISIIILFGLVCSFKASGLSSFQTTWSAGHFRDQRDDNFTTLYYTLRHQYTGKNGIETYIDLGLNNYMTYDEWGVYPYLLYVKYSLDSGTEDLPFHKSKIQLGRQLLVEGMEYAILDGIQSKFYLNSNYGLNFYGGGLHIIEDDDLNFYENIYGASLFYRSSNSLIKIGPQYRHEKSWDKTYGNISYYLNMPNVPLTPDFHWKEEFDLKDGKRNQSIYDLSWYKGPVDGSFYYTVKDPVRNPISKRSFIYRILSSEKVDSLGTSLTLNWMPTITTQIRAENNRYNSPGGIKEKGELQEISLYIPVGHMSISPSYTHMYSYGGEVSGPGVTVDIPIDHQKEFTSSFTVVKIKKINQINMYAYHLKGAINFNFISRWRSMIGVEVEKNHKYNFDARAVLYATYYYF